MTHYEQRLEHDLSAIRERIAEIASRVEAAIEGAVRALLQRDRILAAEIILGDLRINRATREVDRLCHAFVALHMPSAGHLRYVSAVMRLSVAVERIGDYAVTIAREAVQLSNDVPGTVARDIEGLAEQSVGRLSAARRAFDSGDADAARVAAARARGAKSLARCVFADLLAEAQTGVSRDLFALLIAINRLERVGDQAKNICEETVFAATGETKQPKMYRVLFLDERNTVRSVMAEAVARKAFPESGIYASAGWEPAEATQERVAEFLGRHGHDVRELRPTPLPTRAEELDEYHVIVGFEPRFAERLTGIPFHTAILEWTVGQGADDSGWELADDALERLYRELSVQVRDLMVTLRGEQAS